MKLTLQAILAGILIAAATAHAAEDRTLKVSCWKADLIAKAVEAKRFNVVQFWDAEFSGGNGLLAHMRDPKDGSNYFFAIDAEWGCLVAGAKPDVKQNMVMR